MSASEIAASTRSTLHVWKGHIHGELVKDVLSTGARASHCPSLNLEHAAAHKMPQGLAPLESNQTKVTLKSPCVASTVHRTEC